MNFSSSKELALMINKTPDFIVIIIIIIIIYILLSQNYAFPMRDCQQSIILRRITEKLIKFPSIHSNISYLEVKGGDITRYKHGTKEPLQRLLHDPFNWLLNTRLISIPIEAKEPTQQSTRETLRFPLWVVRGWVIGTA